MNEQKLIAITQIRDFLDGTEKVEAARLLPPQGARHNRGSVTTSATPGGSPLGSGSCPGSILPAFRTWVGSPRDGDNCVRTLLLPAPAVR